MLRNLRGKGGLRSETETDTGIKIKKGEERDGLWQKQNDIEYVAAREEIDRAKDLNTSLYSSLASSTVHR